MPAAKNIRPQSLITVAGNLATRTGNGGIIIDVTGKRAVRAAHAGPLHLPKLRRFLALTRKGLYWMHPEFGTTADQLLPETQFLLWERTDRTYGVLIPLVDGDMRVTLSGSANGLSLDLEGALPAALPARVTAAFAMGGSDPFALVREAMTAIANLLGTFRTREHKPLPAFADYLGWCTWDAFYQNVTERKILSGLRSFHKGGMKVPLVILDDGWEQYSGDFLDSFEPDPAKFPRGLAPLITRAKQEFGVKLFGIHHPFQGYWAGINPKKKLAASYRLIHNQGNIRPWLGEQKSDLYLVHPDDIARFYDDFYAYLRKQGADMVKVDGQSALELFTEGVLGRVEAMRRYQYALQGAAATHFTANLIPCMSNGSDVALHLAGTNGWRNSHDYFPAKPHEVQKAHIFINAMNAVWTATFAQPDWDMFQSHQPEAAFHAAARAISGGPVYVCDKPGKQRFDILRKLCLSDGRVLRCAHPAQPTRDRLFIDCRTTRRLLKVVNTNDAIGVLGLFHCHISTTPITDTFRASDIPNLSGSRFAVYLHNQQLVTTLKRSTSFRLTLESLAFELATLSPIIDGIAPLGLLDKYNGSRAVSTRSTTSAGVMMCGLADGGRAGFYCARKPKRVMVDGRARTGSYDADTGLLTVDLSVGREHRVEIAC